MSTIFFCNKMKILIIENVWMGGAKYGLFDKLFLTSFSILPTIHARQIAAITPKKHQIIMLNERYSKINYDEDYDLVNINFTTSTAPRAYEIAKKYRKKGKKVVLSGLHVAAVPNEAKKFADSVLLGRGELNWLTLLSDLENGKLKELYPSESYKKSTKIPPTKISLPGFVVTGAVEATRGCPYRCDFCPESNIDGGGKYFTRPVDEVIDEIRHIPQKSIMFYDSSLTINPTYTKELFQKIIPLKKRFFCNGNSNVLARDEELVKLSKEAGCVSWLVGFESVSQKTIDSIGKNSNKVSEYKKAVENIHKYKMAVIGDFIFGFDTDTKDVFKDTMSFIKDLKIDLADFCILTPFPGTPIFNKLKNQKRLITEDWKDYYLRNVVFKPKNMTKKELTDGVKNMYSEFYSTPYTVKRILRSMRLGFYPFILVLIRNAISNMNSRKLLAQT